MQNLKVQGTQLMNPFFKLELGPLSFHRNEATILRHGKKATKTFALMGRVTAQPKFSTLLMHFMLQRSGRTVP